MRGKETHVNQASQT